MKNKVIFSVYNGSNLDEMNHTEMLNQLESLKPVEAEGKYKGQRESSIVVNAKHLNLIKFIAKGFNQESILLIDSIGEGFLIYLNDNRLEKIGKMIPVNQQEAFNQDAYTKVNGKYFTIK